MNEELRQIEAALAMLLVYVERSRFATCYSPTWSEAVAAAAVIGPEAVARLRAYLQDKPVSEAPS